MNKKRFPIFISLLITSIFFTIVFYYANTNIEANNKHTRAKNFYDARLSENLSKDEIDKLKNIGDIKTAGGTSAKAKSAILSDNLISLVSQDLETNAMRNYNYLIAGNFPKNKNEIVLDQALVEKENLHIGDEIEIDFGKRLLDGEEIDARSLFTDKEIFEKSSSDVFKLVGINKNVYNENLKIYYGLTLIDDDESLIPLINFTDFKSAYENRDRIEEEIKNVLNKEVDLEINESLVIFYGLDLSPYKNMMTQIINVLAIFLCVGIFVFFIKNIFWVWGLRKIRELSVYKSIGSSNFQIYMILLKDAFIISIFPILLGHGLGFLFVKYLFSLANKAKKDIAFFENVNFSISLSLIIILVALSILLLAVIFPAIKISKIDIIQGIKGNISFSRNSKKKRHENLWKELRINNLSSIKSQRYISSIGILIVSIFCIFFSIASHYRDFYYFYDGYDLSVSYFSKDSEIPSNLVDILDDFDGNGYISKEKYVAIENNLELSETAKAYGLDKDLAKLLKEANKNYIQGKIIALEEKDLEKIGGSPGGFFIYNKTQKDPNEPIRKEDFVKYFEKPEHIYLRIGEDDYENIVDIKIAGSIDKVGDYISRLLPFEISLYTDFDSYNKLMEKIGDEKYLDYPFELKIKLGKADSKEAKSYIKDKIESSISYDQSFSIFTKEEKDAQNFTDVKYFKTVIYGIALVIFLLNITNGYSSINISLMSRKKEIGSLYSIGMDIDDLKKQYSKEFVLEQGKSFGISIIISIILAFVISLFFKDVSFKNLLAYFPYLEFMGFSILVYGINFLIYLASLKAILKNQAINLIRNVDL